MVTGAAMASAGQSSATSSAYSSGYAAGSANTAASTTSAYNAGVATGSANTASAYQSGYAAGSTSAALGSPAHSPPPAGGNFAMGAIYATLPAGCISPKVQGKTYYLCGNTWFQPQYGANGVFYKVVPTP
jgi:hypothetical protein